MPRDVREPEPAGSSPSLEDRRSLALWAAPSLRAVVLWALAFAGFVAFPDWLVNHAFDSLRPSGRDALVLLWIVVWFVGMSWLFVRLQRGDER